MKGEAVGWIGLGERGVSSVEAMAAFGVGRLVSPTSVCKPATLIATKGSTRTASRRTGGGRVPWVEPPQHPRREIWQQRLSATKSRGNEWILTAKVRGPTQRGRSVAPPLFATLKPTLMSAERASETQGDESKQLSVGDLRFRESWTSRTHIVAFSTRVCPSPHAGRRAPSRCSYVISQCEVERLSHVRMALLERGEFRGTCNWPLSRCTASLAAGRDHCDVDKTRHRPGVDRQGGCQSMEGLLGDGS